MTIHLAQLESLHPTQMTVGMWEVIQKRNELKQKNRRSFIADHPFPAVLGPNNGCYITDHHHLGLALLLLNELSVFINVVQDYSDLDEKTFWHKMVHNHHTHPYDECGQLHSP